MSVSILIGDCREKLRELPDASVNCCVTSPPYFGLRDYGVEGQMGLEPTPDEFVAGMVEVFREVRRVLRDDGTLWLNIGDSYAGGGGFCATAPSTATSKSGKYGTKGAAMKSVGNVIGCKAKDLIGIPWMLAFALRQPWTDWQIKDEAMRAWVAGIVDGEGCITIQKTKSSHCDSLSFPPIVQVRMCDREPLDRLVAVAGSKIGEPQHPPSQVAANQRPSWQWKVSAERAAKIIAEIYPFLTCKRKQAIVAWNHQQFRTERGNQARAQSELEREQFCKALINDLNQRKPVDLPSWMIEPKIVQEPGWYLRQDCIWSKPNPMPESVRDRCTKAHEYLFLLSKGPRYFYDADAIAEEGSGRIPGNKAPTAIQSGSVETAANGHGIFAAQQRPCETRNKRSVWEVATVPFADAHFATYPPTLIEPCILAGTPDWCCSACGAPWLYRANYEAQCKCENAKGARATVLDPFGGAGTTGLVADRLGRNAVLIELNPEYAAIAERRLNADSPLFAEVKAA